MRFEGLVLVEIVPILIIAVFTAHLHRIFQRQHLLRLERLVQCARHESVDEDFLILLLHIFNSSVPSWIVIVLVKRTASHWIIKHIFKLLMRDWVDLVCFAFVLFNLFVEFVIQVIRRAAVDIAFIID